MYPERAVEDNDLSSMALQIAAEAPGSRLDKTVTIHNASTGNPTELTVYADGDGMRVHDISGGIGGLIESALSLVLNIAALVTGQNYLYFAAAAVDTAQGGQDLASGQTLPGILSLAEAVSAGISGAVGTPAAGAAPTSAQVTAQVLNVAAQGVGGVYGIVQSAENGNAAGILAGALEAAAAGAAGIGMGFSDGTQVTLNQISAELGTAGIATNMASDFASGNLGQGLVDSLNLYLPAVAQAFVNSQNNSIQVQQPLIMYSDAFAAAVAAAGNPSDTSDAIAQAFAQVTPVLLASGAPTQYAFTINTAAFDAAAAAADASG